MRRDRIIQELLQDNNIEFDFIRSLEKRGNDYSFANLALQAQTDDFSRVYPHFGKEFVTWESSIIVPSAIMINFNGFIPSIGRLFSEDLIESLSALYISNSKIDSIGGYKSWFVKAYTSLRDSYLKLWDFNFTRMGYCLAGGSTLEIINVKSLVTPYKLDFNILRSGNVLNISSKVAPVGGTKDYTIELDFRHEGTTNNKVTIDMENLSGWNVEIIFGDFCRDNEVEIVNVEGERDVEVNYIGEASIKVNNVVMINGTRKL